MTPSRFHELLSTVTVRDVAGGPRYHSGLFVEGMTREELAELITLAGEALGEFKDGRRVNPEWIGERAGDWEFIYHSGVTLPAQRQITVRYEIATEPSWCLTHRRIATHVRIKEGCERPDLNPPEPHCDPELGGITMPCRCVPLFERPLQS